MIHIASGHSISYHLYNIKDIVVRLTIYFSTGTQLNTLDEKKIKILHTDT